MRTKLDRVRNEIVNDKKFACILPISLLNSRNGEITDKVRTAGTDGTKHYWNPQLDESIVDQAIDQAANNFLNDCGLTVPNDAVFDIKYKGWSIRDIALDIKNNPQQNPRGQQPTDDHGLMMEATAEQQQAAQQAADKAVADAIIMSEMKKSAGIDDDEGSNGQGKDHLASMLDAARAGRYKAKDWRTELEEFTGTIREGTKVSTYNRPCRRPIEGVIRPGHKKEGKPHIGVILDTSGSMYSKLPKVLAELEVMSDGGFTFEVICTDGDIYGPFSFEKHSFDYRDLPLQGGGGSNMVPAFEHLREHCPDCEAIVFCTDGDIQWPSKNMIDSLGAPAILVEFSQRKSKEGKRFHNHIFIRG